MKASETEFLKGKPIIPLKKSHRHQVKRNLTEIRDLAKQSEVMMIQPCTLSKKVPRNLFRVPHTNRKPGPWRVLEVFTWTCMITIVASKEFGWEGLEPITLPKWDLEGGP
jgi:hypothetical protein